MQAITYKKEVCFDYVCDDYGLIDETWIPSEKLAYNSHDGKLYVYKCDSADYGKSARHNNGLTNMDKMDSETRQYLVEHQKQTEVLYAKRCQELTAQADIKHIELDSDTVNGLIELYQLRSRADELAVRLQTRLQSEASNKETKEGLTCHSPSVVDFSYTNNTITISDSTVSLEARNQLAADMGMDNPEFILVST